MYHSTFIVQIHTAFIVAFVIGTEQQTDVVNERDRERGPSHENLTSQ
jgi:hypothetical protein